ncbi:atypical kinase COQ8B, mitochondrial-like [Phasianus colchicus]|uniref:atypical kinase COQ8B, mitochondrial-like n=1 Tax=Phasianus colchicus TaxID=9054 RepID=UPI00129DE703|nr:atypical kinase COQ8B, mitochondrial-like [Phasianus colchicus]
MTPYTLSDPIRPPSSPSRLLAADPALRVPRVVAELSSGRVLSTELAQGRPLSRCQDLPQLQRDLLCSLLLRLCLRELFEFRFLQSDANAANFLFDPRQQRLTLLDFGSCCSFEPQFTDHYIEVRRPISAP